MHAVYGNVVYNFGPIADASISYRNDIKDKRLIIKVRFNKRHPIFGNQAAMLAATPCLGKPESISFDKEKDKWVVAYNMHPYHRDNFFAATLALKDLMKQVAIELQKVAAHGS